MPWEMRVRVAYYIAQALDHCNAVNQKIYHDLNAYRILFDEVRNKCFLWFFCFYKVELVDIWEEFRKIEKDVLKEYVAVEATVGIFDDVVIVMQLDTETDELIFVTC